MARLELGPALYPFRTMAREAIDRHFRPVRLQAELYTRKVIKARRRPSCSTAGRSASTLRMRTSHPKSRRRLRLTRMPIPLPDS